MKQKSMVRQAQEALQVQLRIGEKRHDAKKAEHTHSPAGIFSYRTFETCMKQSCAFANWAKAQYKCRTLEAARPYVETYLQNGIDRACPPIPCLPRERRCANSTSVRRKPFILPCPTGNGRALIEDEMKPPEIMDCPKRTTRIFLLLQKQPACAAMSQAGADPQKHRRKRDNLRRERQGRQGENY